MMMANNVVTMRLHPLIFPNNIATAGSTESAGDEDVISAGC
jgi:hypothetical protein